MTDPTTDLANLIQFHFLQTIPYVEALEQSDDNHCFICTEPYDMLNREWTPGALHNFPIRLPCRHVLGIQCLARWMLSPAFNNKCGLCRATILLEPGNGPSQGDTMNLVRLFISLRVGILRVSKEEVLYATSVLLESSPNMRTSRIGRDRTMMLFEEFLDHFAREDRRRRLEGRQPNQVMGRRVTGIEQAVETDPVEPRLRRTSVWKLILFSLGGPVLFMSFVVPCDPWYQWTQLVVNSHGGIDVVFDPTLALILHSMFPITLGMISVALLVFIDQYPRD